MENFDNLFRPTDPENNQVETHESLIQRREKLIKEIDNTAETLKEFGTPDTERLSNKSFHVYDRDFNTGSFEASYEKGEMQHATVHLEGLMDKFDATLEYDQIRDAWLMHSIENEEPKLIQNLSLMIAMTTPTKRTEELKNTNPEDVTFTDLVNFFSTRTKNFIDEKVYTTSETDIQSLDDFGEVKTSFTVSSSIDRKNNFRKLEVIRQSLDMTNDEEPIPNIDKHYSLFVRHSDISYKEDNMSSDEAKHYLQKLKDDKSFSAFSL